MKTLQTPLIGVLLGLALISCGGNAAKQPATSKGFAAIEAEMKNEFGVNAYYTDLTILYHKGLGNTITTTVTNNPESLKMGQWAYTTGQWKQTSEVTLEIPKGTKAADFMFQLNEQINLEKLGELIEKAKETLTTEKEITNPRMEQAYIYYPKNGNIEEAQYSIRLEPENGGTTFRFEYQLDGTLIKMDY